MIYILHPPELYQKKMQIIKLFENPKVTLGETTGKEIWYKAWNNEGDMWTDDFGQGYMFGYITDETYTIQNCAGHYQWSADQWREALSIVEDHAKSLGLRYMRIQGRQGWSRLFPDYSIYQVKLEREL